MAVPKAFQYEFRPKLIDHIVEELIKGETTALIGIPGIGKTNAVYWIQKKLLESKKEILLVRIDFNNLISMQDLEFYRLLLLELYQAVIMYLKGHKDLKELTRVIYKDHIESTDALLIFSAIRSIFTKVLENSDIKICIMMNDFEKTTNISPTIFNSLLALRSLNKTNVVFLFISTESIEKNKSIKTSGELINLINYNKHWLTFLNKEETFLLIREFEEILDKKISDDEKERIWHLSKGHAWYIKVLTKIFAEKEVSVDTPFKEIANMTSIKSRAFQIWNSFEEKNQEVIQKVALAQNGGVKSIPEFLIKTGVIIKKGKGLDFFSPLFKHYVQNRALENGYHDTEVLHTEKGKDSQKGLSLDVKKRQLLKNGIPIQKPLTRNEFNLLKYFFENAELAVTRDDIADVLWGKDTSQKYSDWAIDKIISRIREKIESDPKKPVHLLTMRGVGFKFNNLDK